MAQYRRQDAKRFAREKMRASTNAPPTPFREDFSLDTQGLYENVEKYIEMGLYGLMTGGNMAEGWNMTPEEWQLYSKTCAEANKGKMLLVSVILDASPIYALEKIKFLDAIGFDLVEIINPIIQLRSDDDIYGYFRYLNDKSPLGIVLYNTPTAGRTLGHPLIKKLAELDMVVGIKNGLLNPADTIALRKEVGEQIVVTEPMESIYLWDAAVHGGQCLFGTLEHIAFGKKRETLIQLMQLAESGKIEEGLPLYRELDPIRDLMDKVFTWNIVRKNQYTLAPIKYWLELLGLKMGPVRPPLQTYCDAESKTLIDKALKAYGVI